MKLANAIGRSTEEWIGATPDAPVPPRVCDRQFLRDDGKCQCGCGLKIRPGDKWETDHKVALINGGENRESNLTTLLAGHHKKKTAGDVAEKSKIARIRMKHNGVKRKKKKMAYRKFDGTPVPARYE